MIAKFIKIFITTICIIQMNLFVRKSFKMLIVILNIYSEKNQQIFSQDKTKDLDRSFALTLIFSRLTSPELLRCALVCSKWKRLSRNPNLWKIVCFKNTRLAPEVLRNIHLCDLKKIKILLLEMLNCFFAEVDTVGSEKRFFKH